MPINFYNGSTILKKIHFILTLLRFIEHGTLIILSFILFDNIQTLLAFKIYICVSFVSVFGLYFYIVVYSEATQSFARSTNRTLHQLLKLKMYNEIEEMYVFGFKYSDQDWIKAMQDEGIDNKNIVCALTVFLSSGVIDVDNIFSSIESVIDTPSFRHDTVLHFAAHDEFGSVECLSKLLQHNANPNVKDYMHYTPLHLAIVHSKGANRLSKLNLL